MLRVCQIEDAEEEKSSVYLKDVMKAGDGETSVGFGSEETATFSASVNVSLSSSVEWTILCAQVWEWALSLIVVILMAK